TRFFAAIALFRLFRYYGNILHPALAYFTDLSLMIHPNSHKRFYAFCQPNCQPKSQLQVP
ncbi:MAG: hypothetical protein ACOYJB_10225, partial [Christensenellaceae bacterium]